MTLTGKEMISYLYQREGWVVNPIWGLEREFPFTTFLHIEFGEALGFESYQATPYIRLIRENSILNEEHLDQIIERHYFDYSYFEPEFEELERLKKQTDFVGGGVTGPLTMAAVILGPERTAKFVKKNPKMLAKFLDYVTGFIIKLAKEEEKRGAKFFWIAEGFPTVLNPKNFEEFSGKYLKRVYDSINIPGFLHVCGPATQHIKYMEQTGAQVLSVDELTDIGKVIRMVDENTIVMGNVSCMTFFQESETVVEKEIYEVFDTCRNYKNFIVSAGCAIIDGTPEKYVRKLFDIAKTYPVRSNAEYRELRKMIHLLNSGGDIERYAQENMIADELVSVAKEESIKIKECRAYGKY